MFADLSRPCDACGNPIGGGFKHCKKCNIWFCFYCGTALMNYTGDFPLKCPMRGGKFE
ncbi:MAG: hypothetical protein NWE84_02050 [Candidatus Bathyarchaeota archaeon]|nr:hypothetical protein [Candidatus Bathyarchaeota archaeon]